LRLKHDWVSIFHCSSVANDVVAETLSLIQAQLEDFKVYQQQVLKNCKAMAQTMLDHGYQLVSGMKLYLLKILNFYFLILF